MFRIISDNNIDQYSGIKLSGWDQTNKSLKVSVVGINDPIVGINTIPIVADVVYENIIITNGTLYHIDTSLYNIGDQYTLPTGQSIGLIRSVSTSGSVYLTLSLNPSINSNTKKQVELTPNADMNDREYTVPSYQLNSSELIVNGLNRTRYESGIVNYEYTEIDSTTIEIRDEPNSLIYPDSKVIFKYNSL